MSQYSRYYRGAEGRFMAVFAAISLPFTVLVIITLLKNTTFGVNQSMYNLVFGIEGLILLTNGILQVSRYNAGQTTVSKVLGTGLMGLGLLMMAEGVIVQENTQAFVHQFALVFFGLFSTQQLVPGLDAFWNKTKIRHWWILIAVVILIMYAWFFPDTLPGMRSPTGRTFSSALMGHLAAFFLFLNALMLTIRIIRRSHPTPWHLPLLLLILALHSFMYGIHEPWTSLWWISVYITVIGAMLAYVATITSLSDILSHLNNSLDEINRTYDLVRQSEQKYKNIFANMVDGFARHKVIRDDAGQAVDYIFVEVNKGFERFTGLKADEMIGKRVTQVIPGIEKDPANWIQVYGEIADTGATRQFESFAMEFHKWYRITAYSSEKGFFTTIFTDITEQRKQISELRLAKFKAEESDRMKSAFLANVSHEIRTPLNTILGFSEILLDEKSSRKERQNYLEIIFNSGNRLLKTINNIIQISKIESGKMPKEEADIHAFELIQAVLAEQKLSAKNKGLELKIAPSDQQAVTFRSDPNMLFTVLSNLLNNAIKYTPEGYVELGYTTDSQGITFFVRDTGIGISQENLPAIFDRFYQEDMSMGRQFGGMGIGLAICQAMVEELGGRIWVESEKGEGSRFFVEIGMDWGEYG